MLERLALIALGRAAGFTLDEIARMFAPDGRPQIDRHMLAAKAEELDGTIRKLSAMRDGLRHAAACPAPSWMSYLSPLPRRRRIRSVRVRSKESAVMQSRPRAESRILQETERVIVTQWRLKPVARPAGTAMPTTTSSCA